MKYTEVKYSRKYNLGNYESEDYSLAAIVDEDDNVQECLKQIKLEVTSAQSGEPQTGEEDETTKSPPTGKSGKRKSKGDEGDDGENGEEIEGEGEDEEVEDEGNDDADAEDGEESEDSPTTDKKSKGASKKTSGSTDSDGKAGKAPTSGKKFKKKPQVYQRTNETHKEIFSGILKAVAPNWKANDKSKAKAKATSTKLEGTEFLDEDGNVLETFKQSVKKAMK